MKRFKIISWWVIFIAYLFVVPGFLISRHEEAVCENIEVRIPESSGNSFVTNEEINGILNEKNENLLGYPLSSINAKELERAVDRQPFVKKTDIYKTSGGRLVVDVYQRDPVLRIIDSEGDGYYIDKEGVVLPVSSRYTSRVLIANGHIPDKLNPGEKVFSESDGSGTYEGIAEELYTLARFIDSDDFWRSQITQVYVREDGGFELVPRVGAHIIKLGDIKDYKVKFKKLRALYDHDFGEKGWNSYEIIDLRFDNQVVCTRR